MSKRIVVLDASKRETHHAGSGLKRLARRLRGWCEVSSCKDGLSEEALATASLIVFAGPRERFSSAEFKLLKEFMDKGGALLILLGEGGEEKYGTNVNFLLEEFGIAFNSDSVARTVHYKYHHPKEVLVSDGVLNRGVTSAVRDLSNLFSNAASSSSNARKTKASILKRSNVRDDDKENLLEFVYPYGSSLNVQKPAVALLSSGHVTYPLNRPVVACAQTKGSPTWEKKEGGRIGVVGSVEMFSDEWVTKENNEKLFDVLCKWLVGDGPVIWDHADAEDPDINDYHHIPDTEALAERLKSCLEEGEALPQDFAEMFDENLFKFDVSLISEAVLLYQKLGVKHEALQLITPQFDAPLPPLIPAVFPPAMREPPPPALDLFDLDAHFASEQSRLAQLTNKCTDDDLEFYVRESADVLGIVQEMGVEDIEHLKGEHGAKKILEYLLRELVSFKFQQ